MYKPTYSLLERTVHNVKNLGFYVGTDVGINPHVRYIRPLPPSLCYRILLIESLRICYISYTDSYRHQDITDKR